MSTSNLSSAIVAQGSPAANQQVAIPHIFSKDELLKFFRLYRDGRAGFSRSRPQYLTHFSSLEDFIIETRKTNGCINNVASLDILSLDNENAALMRTWLCNVVPSCVYRHKSAQFGQTLFYVCCFPDCATPCSSQFTIVRHYREQHFERLPAGIFGDLVVYKCPTCPGLDFKRPAHLQQHLASNNHLSRLSMLGKKIDCLLY